MIPQLSSDVLITILSPGLVALVGGGEEGIAPHGGAHQQAQAQHHHLQPEGLSGTGQGKNNFKKLWLLTRSTRPWHDDGVMQRGGSPI